MCAKEASLCLQHSLVAVDVALFEVLLEEVGEMISIQVPNVELVVVMLLLGDEVYFKVAFLVLQLLEGCRVGVAARAPPLQ